MSVPNAGIERRANVPMLRAHAADTTHGELLA
jgi:hypothetical protein